MSLSSVYDETMWVRLALYSTIFCLFFLTFSVVSASQSFASAMIRLERQKENISPGNVLVQFTTSNASATEAKLTIEIDSRYQSGVHFSSDPSAYTTSTSNLPSGTTALTVPTGMATSVSGSTVSFSISDLLPNTSYALYITGGFLLNRSADTYRFILSTETSGAIVIDTQNIFLATVANDQLAVSASIASSATNFLLNLTSANTDEYVPQETEVVYTLTYGSELSYATPLTLEVEWAKATSAQSGAQYTVSEYVIGSAGSAYGATAPVVDLENKRIRWTISSFPAGLTGQTISFTMRTTSGYTGSDILRFPVTARILAPTQSGDNVYTKQYRYVAQSSTTEPNATSSPSPIPVATQIPSHAVDIQVSQIPTFSSISIASITETQMRAQVELSDDASLTVRYGQSQGTMSNTFRYIEYSRNHDVSLSDLKPGSTYYMVLTATNSSGSVNSDILVFSTGVRISNRPVVKNDSLIVLHANNVISPTAEQDNLPVYLLTKDEVIDIVLSIAQYQNIKSVIGYIQNRRVLGITVQAAEEPPSGEIVFVQTKPGTFAGRFKLSHTSQDYSVFVEITDIGKNKIQYEVLRVHTVEPLKIVNEKNEPIEAATVFVQIYNPQTKLFQSIPSNASAIRSKYASDSNGVVPLNLGPGLYELEVVAGGYETKKIRVDLQEIQDTPYPTLVLEKKLGGLFFWGVHAYDTVKFTWSSIAAFILSLAESQRLLSLLLTLSVFVSLFCTLLVIADQLHLRPLEVPIYLLHTLRHIVSFNPQAAILHGLAANTKTNYPIHGVKIVVVNALTNKVLKTTSTDALGEFTVTLPSNVTEIKIIAGKRGYYMETYPSFSVESIFHDVVHVYLTRNEAAGIVRLLLAFESLGASLFTKLIEIFLVFTLGIEVLYSRLYGIEQSLQFFIPTILSFVLLLYLHDLKLRETIRRL